MEEVIRLLPGEVADVARTEMDRLTEIRIRAGRPVLLVRNDNDIFCGAPVTAQHVQKLALIMMEHSYYTREDELSQGFFTMKNGCRVGVCGAYAVSDHGNLRMRAIGSLCIRIARAVPGCGTEVAGRMMRDGLKGALIASRPGMGKTTLLRDAARILSEAGFTVGIADERHEIAACRNGIPGFDVGCRTDVADGCPKHLAMLRLIRSMSPRIIVTDEIGDERDVEAVCEAAGRGMAVLTSAHASGKNDLMHGAVGKLIRRRVFDNIFLLDGIPGKIAEVWSVNEEA